jgi:CheY-like chemotaxis protein
MSSWFELPSAFGPHEAPTLGQRRRRGRTGPADLLILVVDDDADARAIYCAAIHHLGYRVAASTDGRRALGIARRRLLDAVLIDVSMPGLSGIETTRLLKEQRSQTFVVAMTGAGDRYFDEAHAAGCDGFLCKPFNPFVLEEILGALRRRKDGEVVKRCGCGREHTRRSWKSLRLVGTMEGAELRNCACGSTIALGDLR